jgi:hypothetical protein
MLTVVFGWRWELRWRRRRRLVASRFAKTPAQASTISSRTTEPSCRSDAMPQMLCSPAWRGCVVGHTYVNNCKHCGRRERSRRAGARAECPRRPMHARRTGSSTNPHCQNRGAHRRSLTRTARSARPLRCRGAILGRGAPTPRQRTGCSRCRWRSPVDSTPRGSCAWVAGSSPHAPTASPPATEP